MSSKYEPKKDEYRKSNNYAQNESKEPPTVQMDKLINLFWENEPFVRNIRKNDELEVKFGTRGIKPLTKIDFDNVIRKLKSFGFTCANEEGYYLLRIQNQFLDPISGVFKLSQVRTEIDGFHTIQEYCKHNDINKLLNENAHSNNIKFVNKGLFSKGTYATKDLERIRPVNFDDFNFRVSYNVENILQNKGIVSNIIKDWEKSKKSFRYLNRVTFIHPEYPIKVDMSIVKSSKYEGGNPILEYTTGESNVFKNQEIYEIELEVDNSEIGHSKPTNSPAKLLEHIRKTIKYVLMGLQETNYPVSYPEQRLILQEYMKIIHAENYDPKKHERVYSNNFIGPSPKTLQINNIVKTNDNILIPNIRNEYTVTDKADGERYLMIISSKGKIYLINQNMKVLFTGTETDEKEVFNTLIDGELILHNKNGKFINLYASFDIYYINKKDVRPLGFIPKTSNDTKSNFRVPLLKHVISLIKPKSIVKDDIISPIRIESKQFYPLQQQNQNIFEACKLIMDRDKEGLFEYNTDGLIFTPANMGVGVDEIGKIGKITKTTWDYAFKWKPTSFNTIDFLVTTKKSKTGLDEVTSIFQDGLQTSSVNQIKEYKTIILRCGFSESRDGYINPCQDIINDNLPTLSTGDNNKKNDYYPLQFYPSDPYDPTAGICNIILKNDDTGIQQMYTEGNEIFGDNAIVEFRYEIDNESGWRWIPIRVRYDKTSENAYRTANNNWHSIHNPITEEMLCTGNNIPEEVIDDDVYYNNFTGNSKTRGLRDFHNLFVKKLLITSVSKRNDTLIDFACGKGGDLSKWVSSKLSFVFGIDIAKDNLENRLNGACARYLNCHKDFKNIPHALFVNGNSSLNIRNGTAMLNDKAVQITKAVFGQGHNDEEKLGKGVAKQFGKGEEGFNVSSCQFALHYFFENQKTFQNFIRNVSECTKLGGYFIGTCYDGKIIFNLLKKKKIGENIELYDGSSKIWEIVKDYDDTKFDDDVTSLGYRINVFQESINKSFTEYLVNFDYLERIMENYGFNLVQRDDAKILGLPDGSGLFSDLFNKMQDELKKNSFNTEYGTAKSMNANEKKISFLNRYFVFKKISHVNSEKISLELIDESLSDRKHQSDDDENYEPEPTKKEKEKEKEKEHKTSKSKAKRLNKKIVLVPATEEVDSLQEEEIKEPEPESDQEEEPQPKEPEQEQEPEIKEQEPKELLKEQEVKSKRTYTKKPKIIIADDNEEIKEDKPKRKYVKKTKIIIEPDVEEVKNPEPEKHESEKPKTTIKIKKTITRKKKPDV